MVKHYRYQGLGKKSSTPPNALTFNTIEEIRTDVNARLDRAGFLSIKNDAKHLKSFLQDFRTKITNVLRDMQSILNELDNVADRGAITIRKSLLKNEEFFDEISAISNSLNEIQTVTTEAQHLYVAYNRAIKEFDALILGSNGIKQALVIAERIQNNLPNCKASVNTFSRIYTLETGRVVNIQRVIDNYRKDFNDLQNHIAVVITRLKNFYENLLDYNAMIVPFETSLFPLLANVEADTSALRKMVASLGDEGNSKKKPLQANDIIHAGRLVVETRMRDKRFILKIQKIVDDALGRQKNLLNAFVQISRWVQGVQEIDVLSYDAIFKAIRFFNIKLDIVKNRAKKIK